VELVANLAVADQAELRRHRFERLGHRAEGPGEVAVVACPTDVVEHAEQLTEHRRNSILADGLAVALNPAAVVDVLRLHPLQLFEPLGGQRLGGSELLRADCRLGAGLRWLVGGGTLAGRPQLTCLRVDATAVAHDRAVVRLLDGHLSSFSSSTISASTTSSSSVPAAPEASPAVSPAAVAPDADGCALA